MSDHDAHPLNQPREQGPSQLPAVPQMSPGMLGTPLPAAPWIESSESKEGFDFSGFLHSLRRKWLIGAGVGLIVATILAGFLYLVVPVKYKAIVMIRVRRNQDVMLRDKNPRAVLPQEYEIEKQTQATLLKSGYVIEAALRDPEISELPIVRDEPWPRMGKRENPIAWLESQLKVDFPQGSEILFLTMRERDQDQLRKLLDAITKAYMKNIVHEERTEQTKKLETLKETQRDRMKDLNDQLAQVAQLAKTYGSNKSENVQHILNMGFTRLATLDRERISADQTYYETLDYALELQQRMQANATFTPHEFEIEDMLLQYPEYANMKAEVVELKSRMGTQGGVGGGAGMASAYQARLSSLESQMEQFKYEMKGEAVQRLKLLTNNDERMQQQEMQAVQLRLDMAKQRRALAHQEYEALKNELTNMGTYNADLEVRQLEIEALQNLTEKLSEEIETLELDMQSKPQIEVLQWATIPDTSNWIMRYMQIIAAWCLAMLGTVLGFAFWDLLGKRVNTSEEVTDVGDVRVIGTLPALNSRRAGGLLSHNGSSRRAVEIGLTRSIDSIRTTLQFAKGQKPYEVVLISSALGQEGKTTVASQLAVSYARAGRRTLLIDGDLRNPQLHVVLGMPFQRGLCELLRSEATLDDVVQPTPAEGLWSLCSGRRDGSTDQALASPVVAKLFAELRHRFDTIVVDTGPVLTSPDALLLGQLADAAILSVRRDVSRMPKVTEARNRLRSVGVNVVGAVVNGVAIDIRQSELTFDEESVRNEPQLERVS